MTAAQMSEIMDTKLHGAILEQDQRLQAMMAQVMIHIEERFNHVPTMMAPMQQAVSPNGIDLDEASMEVPEAMNPPTMPR